MKVKTLICFYHRAFAFSLKLSAQVFSWSFGFFGCFFLFGFFFVVVEARNIQSIHLISNSDLPF